VTIFGVTTFAPKPAHHLLPPWALHLGIPGLLLASFLDSSIIPLPVPGTTDLLLLWLVSHNGNPWELASCAIVASLAGGYTTWRLGKQGGEAALQRWVPARILTRIEGWAKRHRILAVFLPAILPPPIPLSPFLLAAGALGVARRPFLLSFGAARVLRYSFVAWLAATYGRHIVRLWSGTLEKWSTPLLWTFAVVMVSGVILGIVKLRSGHGAGRNGAGQAGSGRDESGRDAAKPAGRPNEPAAARAK
jgi:membrane protein YqaA with SNARE-associated domain